MLRRGGRRALINLLLLLLLLSLAAVARHGNDARRLCNTRVNRLVVDNASDIATMMMGDLQSHGGTIFTNRL
jgi:hypothetical protein